MKPMWNKIIYSAVGVFMLTAGGCDPRFETGTLRTKAEQGDAEAQYVLAQGYAHGRGIGMDRTEAAKWFRKAAEQGYAKAQYHLGFCYLHGKGVVLDKLEAVKWYRLAAEQGFAMAQFQLGDCYYRGEGPMEDIIEAYKWKLLARTNGLKPAGEECTALAAKMSAAQIAEAEARAKQWQQEHRQTNPATK